jgi:hypothetical protein
MEAHPDETDPARKGAYFSREEGECLWCGMQLKPADELAWLRVRRAAAGAEVAYTCPQHQHVFSKTSGSCPRCKHDLKPFKVMYTCPDPQHSTLVRPGPGTCPKDGRALAPMRGVWLSPDMSEKNLPADPSAAREAGYGCELHPLVTSNVPGNCPICAADLVPRPQAAAATQPVLPPGAAWVCPMQECEHFAVEPGSCPKCGMRLKPIEDVEWARSLREPSLPALATNPFVCPMHPSVGAEQPGTCPVCGMQLVAAGALPRPTTPPAVVQTQMDFIMEHYLELHRRLAADSLSDVALHALGLVGAADEILKRVSDPALRLPESFWKAAEELRAAALRLTGKSLQDDRVTFVALGRAMRELVTHVRPSRQRYPKIYVFHCPMTKGDWLQTSEDMANPFYGFAMLKCGELEAAR